MSPQTSATAAPPELTADERREAELADAASAAALAGGDPRQVAGSADIPGESAGDSGVAGDSEAQPDAARQPRTAEERRSAAALRAGGEPAVPINDRGGDPGPTASPAAAPQAGVAVPLAGEEAPLTPEEMDFIKRMRRSRAQEIRDEISLAPAGVGTNVNQFTLVHLRGCPRPERTEVYEDMNTSTGQRFTIHRCIECGAHNAIPH